MFTKFPFSSRLILFVFVPCVLIFVIFKFVFYLSLPNEDGYLTLEGLSKKVEIKYDVSGIPHIFAATDLDAYYSLGFVHSQNRLWQMEMNRRLGAGKLSEVLGKDALPYDIYMRTLRLTQNAEKIWANLPLFEKSVLLHYVQGVNAGISQLRVLPIEYYILGFKPEKWTPVDSLLWMQLMAVQLSNNMAAELQRSSLLQSIGCDKTNDLMPEIKCNELVQLSNSNIIPEEYKKPNAFVGSNSWVLSGQKTQSGKPMLANDPHLNNTLPSAFFIAELNGSHINVQGATFPGLPFVIIGKNQHIVWGITNMMADTQDIFLEKINPFNSRQYEYEGKYLDFESTIETIIIKKEPLREAPKPYVFEVRRSRHGPLLSDITGSHKNFAYSLRWTGDDDDGGTFRSLLALGYAKDWASFNVALSTYVSPIHNFIYADVEGNIGEVAPGAYPVRKNGQGSVPVAGWVSKNEWVGWRKIEEWPLKYNPESGIIISANNNILPSGYAYSITNDWGPSYRAKRIEQSINNRLSQKNGRLDMQDFIAIQLDVMTPEVSAMLPRLTSIVTKTFSQKKALDLLKDWDGNMELDSVQATIFTAWLANFNRLLIEDDAGRFLHAIDGHSVLHNMTVSDNLPFLEKVLLEKHEGWCDYLDTRRVETCDELLLIALDHALNELTKKLGKEMSHWRWGALHQAHFPHIPFSESKFASDTPSIDSKVLAYLFHRSLPSKGSGNTVNVATVSLYESSRFAQFIGPAYRQIIDLGRPGAEAFSVSTGQSGNVFSTHYDDWIGPHQNGSYFNHSSSRDSLTLLPKNSED